MDAHGDDRSDASPAADDVTASGGLESDESSDRPPSIVIPQTSRKPRGGSAQHEDPESSYSGSSSPSTSATAPSSRCPRSAGEMRSDREIITMVCSSAKNPEDVDALDLSAVARKTRKTLKSLRALADFANLARLNVSDNAIASVDGVDAFEQLEELSLSRNQLKRIDSPLFSLLSLRRVDLSGNFIAHIPKGFAALEQLEVLHLAGNSLSVLKEVEPLSKLANLYECSFAANPFCKLPTYKEFVICKLPSLEKLDDAAITELARDKSRRRFSEEHFSKDSRLREVGLAHAHEQNKLREARSALEAENVRLKGELQVKSKLLQNKSKEWSAATGQLLQLQQELAMLNLDRRGSLPLGGSAEHHRANGVSSANPLALAFDGREDDGSDFRLNQPFGSASPSRSCSSVVNAAVSPTRPNLRYASLTHSAVSREDVAPVAEEPRASPSKPPLAKRLIDSACSPLRKSVSWSPEKPKPGAEHCAREQLEPHHPEEKHRLAVDSLVVQPIPIAESPQPGRSKSFEQVRRAFSDLALHTSISAESFEQEGVDLAEDDAIKHDVSISRSIRLPTFEDDLACPAYEDGKGAYSLLRESPKPSPRQTFSETAVGALMSPDRLEQIPGLTYQSRVSPPSPHLLASVSPRSAAQRLWERQHAEFREQTLGSPSPRKSSLRFSQDSASLRASVSSPGGRDILARQIQALQSCKQSLVSEIAKEEQLLHALKQEASSYASLADQLHVDIQVCLSDGGGASATAPGPGRKQRDKENYRAKLEFCRSKLRFAEDKEKEIEMAMVRTTKRVLESDVQNAPFDKEIFALTHKLQQVIVHKEEVHQEMSRLMALVCEQQLPDGGGGGRQRRSVADPSKPWQQQTVDEMLEMEEQQQRLSAERQAAVAAARKRLDELQRRYNDVADRVRVKEDLVASLVDELKDVEKELELIGQRVPTAGSPLARWHQWTRSDASLVSQHSVASPEPSPSQRAIDAVELEVAEALKHVKDVQLSAAAAAATAASMADDESSSPTKDALVLLRSDGSSEGGGGSGAASSERDGGYKAPVAPAGPGSAPGAEPSPSRASNELRLKELLTAEVLEEIKKDIYERLSRQLAAAATAATGTSDRSVSQDHADLHDAIAAALETHMKLALASFHKKREGDDSSAKKRKLKERTDRPAPALSASPPRRTRGNDAASTGGSRSSRTETQHPAAKADAPRGNDITCDQLDEFAPLDTYAVKYRFVKHRSSAPPSPSGGAGTGAKPSSRASGAQRIRKACERLEQAESESKVDPISAMELDPMGNKRSSLKVLLMGARDLPTSHLRTKSLDPYVRLEVVYPEHIVPLTASSQLPSFRSRTKKKSVYPVWDEDFEFAPVLSLKGYLRVRVLNDRRLSREQLVGEVRIPLRTLLHQKKTVDWFPLRVAVPSPASRAAGSGDFALGAARKASSAPSASSGAVRLQLQLAYSRVEKYKRAIDELVTKYVHDHNHLPPFIEAAAAALPAAERASATQNQDEHELFESRGFASSSSRSRGAAARENAEALDDLRHHQYRHVQQLSESTAPELDSPGTGPESIIPTFEAWKAERESEALLAHSQQQRARDAHESSSSGEASPQRASVDVKIASRAFDSGSLAATQYAVDSAPPPRLLSLERSRQLWETPVPREPRLAESSRARSAAPAQANLHPLHSTYAAASTEPVHHRLHHRRDRECSASGRAGDALSPSSNHRPTRPTTPTGGSKAPIVSPSSGRPHAADAPSWAGASSVVHHRRLSKTGSSHAQSFNPIARRKTTGTSSHHRPHQQQQQPPQQRRPECFDDYSPYHPAFQYSDPLDLSSGLNSSDLFASRKMKRRSTDVFAWQAGCGTGGATGNYKTNLRIFKSPGFARRQPSAGFPERYIGLDNQTSERLKRMFGRMDTAPS
ncbi:hypothetical protein PybrP1_004917 [[Pythium] brassicae (nom. inval.)]|nr:hypothetical protein PybrP1_004917 [[Pythium] brassicae (nom. inval.)]